MSNKLQDIYDLLKELSKADSADLKRKWKVLRSALDDSELGDLRQHYKSLPPDISQLLHRSAGHQSPGALAGRIAVLRTFALLEGSEAQDELIGIIGDSQELADIKAWALYDLLLAGIKVQKSDWKGLKSPIETALNDFGSQQVRQWAAYLLGEMGQDPKDSKRSYFATPGAKEEAERLLIDQWQREINVYVDRQIVVSLGQVGGYNLSVPPQGCPIVKTLREAAEHVNGQVRILVPDAIAGVAMNVAGRSDIQPEHKVGVIEQLVRVLHDWLTERLKDHENKCLKDHQEQICRTKRCLCDGYVTTALTRLTDIWEDSNRLVTDPTGSPVPLYGENSPLLDCTRQVLQTHSLAYDSYRLAITTTVNIVQKALPPYKALAKAGILMLEEFVEPQKVAPIYLEEDVRARVVQAIGDLAVPPPGRSAEHTMDLCRLLSELTVPRLKTMLADPSEKVWQRVADALVVLMEPKDGIVFFTDAILKGEKVLEAIGHRSSTWCKALSEDEEMLAQIHARKRAAQGLAAIAQRYRPAAGEPEVYTDLLKALHSYREPEHQNAYTAFMDIGGRRGVQALVENGLRQLIEDKYFEPIRKAEEQSERIMKDMVTMSKISYGFSLVAAFAVGVFGVVLLVKSIPQVMIATDAPKWEAFIPVLSGLILTLAGILTPFFWNSAQAVQKVTGQMANAIAAFHSYLGRVRLIGIGFAHVFSKDTEDQRHADFAASMSNAVGQAMIDSSRVLESIGRVPLVEPNSVSVPNFVGESRVRAQTLASGKALILVVKTEDNAAEKDKVLAQDVRAGTEVKPGTSIGVTVSLGPKIN